MYAGLAVTPYYDSMLGKLIVRARDRDTAIKRMRLALAELKIRGVKTSIAAASAALAEADFLAGDYDTSILENLSTHKDSAALEMVAIAAAVARHVDGRSARPVAQGAAGSGTSPWVISGRVTD